MPALQPKFDIDSKFDDGQDLEYSMSFEVYPEMPEIKMDGIKLKRAKLEISDKDIKESYKKLQDAHKDFQPLKKSRAAKKGDTVVMDFEGSVDGKIFEGGTAENFRLELGSNQFIPGYEDQIVGVKKGGSKVVKVKFPDEYNSEELAGKNAEFKVKIHDILVRVACQKLMRPLLKN